MVRRTRPMRREDIADVARLFFSVFRGRAPVRDEEFRRYYEEVFFENPDYAPETGGMVGLDRDGRVSSALSVLPIPFIACGQRVSGRLLCAFSADPKVKDNGATALSLSLHPRHQDFSFTDTASINSADITKYLGAVILPIQSMNWRLPFRPLAAVLEREPGARHARAARLLSALLSPLDRLLQRPAPPVRNRVVAIEPEQFAANLPAMLARFAIRPDFSASGLIWLLEKARANTALGPLALLAVEGRAGKIIGLVAVYVRPGRLARILNIFTLPGEEDDVIAALCGDLRERGATGVVGMAHPFLLAALARQPGLRLRLRGFFCVSTRHPEIREALQRNDVYLGGLAGEGWSRLVSDWH